MTAARDTATRRTLAARRAERGRDDAERLRALVRAGLNAARNADGAARRGGHARLACHLDAAVAALTRARLRLMLARADCDGFPAASCGSRADAGHGQSKSHQIIPHIVPPPGS